MTKTTNYQLNQWAKSDRLRMDDFNANNAKIEAALKSQTEALAAETAAREAANSYVKLVDVSPEVGSTQMDIDVSGINLDDYQKLIIYPQFICGSNSAEGMQINGISSQVYCCYSSGSGTQKLKYAAEFAPDSSRVVEIDLISTSSGIFVLNRILEISGSYNTSARTLPMANLTDGKVNTINFMREYANSGAHAAGSRVTIYGLKR